MAKNKRSKILAMALCASVMTGIYASPVMAAGQINGITLADGSTLVADDQIWINGVELSDEEVKAKGGNFTQLTVTNGMEITGVGLTVGGTSIEYTTGNTVVGGTLTVGGLAQLQGGLKVTGNANLEKLNVNGKLTVDAISGVVADNLTVDTDADVQGDLTVGNALTAGATNVSSLAVNTDKFTVDVYGNTTVGGTLTAGSGNFTVDTDGNTTIIGADKQLTVEGTAQIGTMTATTAQVGGDLTVVGKTTLAGLTAKGAADLQDGLTVSKGATVNGGLTVDTDRFVVDGVTGNTTVGGTLDVTGETTLAGLTAGATTVDSLTVKGAATVDSLEVANSATVGDKLTVGNGLDVTGNALLNNDLTVNGATKLNGDVTVGGEAKFNEKATFNGKAIFNENIDVNGFANLNSGAKVNGELTVNGATKVNDDLTVNGDALVNGKLDVGAGNFTVDTAGNTEFNGNLNIGHDAFEVTAADGSFSAARDKFNVFADGSFNAASENFEVSADGVINADSLYLQTYGDGTLEVGKALQALTDAKLPDKVGGIERNPAGAGDPGDGTTTIEGMAKFDSEGMTIGETVVNDGKITVGAEDAQTIIEGGAITTNTINAGGTIINNAGMTVGDTAVADSKITVGAEGDQTIIEDGAITAKSLVLGTKDVGATIAGIERETVTDEFGTVNTTTIEGALKVSDNGLISNAAGSFTVDSNGGLAAGGGTFAADMTGIKMSAPVQMFLQGDNNYNGKSVIDLGTTISDIDDRLDVLEVKTQNIKPSTGAGTGTGEGGTAAGEGNNIITDVPATEDGHTGINGDVTVGGEINAGEIVVGDKDSDNKTTIDGGNITVNGGENGSTTINGGNITTGDINAGTGNIGGIDMAGGTIKTGDTTITGTGINTANGNFTGNVDVDGKVTVGDGTTITGEGITTGTGTFDDVIIGENTTIDSDGINTNDITAVTGTIGNVDMDNTGIIVGGGTTITEDTVTTENIKAGDGEFDSQVTVGDNTTITDGNINLGGDNGTNINADGMIVGNANGVNTNVSAGDVVITDKDGKDIALSDVGYVENIDRELQANGNYDGTVVGGINAEADIRRAEVNRLDNRISKVEDRVDKVGAMSAAIANLRTMGYDPAAPTEIAVGVGQYRSETGVALGMFHYPNKDFMLSLSVSTSGDEVMGGIGATWKFGRKSPEKVLAAEKEKAAKAKLAKAEAMKKAAKEAKIKAQQERHAKLAAERAAQAEAAK